MISRYVTRMAVPFAVATFLLAACGGAATPSNSVAPTAAGDHNDARA